MVSSVLTYAARPDFCLVISHLSVGAHAVDEEAFQSTMRYIFKFIEKVSLQGWCNDGVLTFPVGETSREHR